MAEKWIQKAIKHPGALKKSLGVKSGEKIPAGKLASAATIGGAAKRLPEQAIGKIYNIVFSDLAKRAPIEGYYSDFNSGYYNDFFNPKKFWRNTARILKTGEGELNIKMGSMPKEDLAEITMPGNQDTKIKEILNF